LVAVTSGVGPGEPGLAGGLFVTAQEVGRAIDIAAIAALAGAQTSAHDGSLVAGYQATFSTAIGIILIAVLTVAIRMRARITERH
jgi:hypothetical protein